jgi:hypothetical protein
MFYIQHPVKRLKIRLLPRQASTKDTRGSNSQTVRGCLLGGFMQGHEDSNGSDLDRFRRFVNYYSSPALIVIIGSTLYSIHGSK